MNHSPLSPIIEKKHLFFSGSVGLFLMSGLASVFSNACLWIIPLLLLVSLQILLRFKNTKWLLLCFFIGCAIGLARTLSEEVRQSENLSVMRSLSANYSQKNSAKAQLLSVNKKDATTLEYIAKLISVEKTRLENRNIRIILKLPLNSFAREGDIIQYTGTLTEILPSETYAFDKLYLSKDIYARATSYSLDIRDHSRSRYEEKIIRLRNLFSEHIWAIYPPQTAAFLGGLLFGDRQNLDDMIDSDFKLSGLSHIVAVSGFNITILIVFCTFLFRFLPAWLRASIITGVVILFLSLVGEQISALRAAIMGLAGYYAITFGRRADLLYILLGTAIFFVILHPLTLIYDVSFHLSFLAVIGMMYTTPFFKKITQKLPEFLGMKEALIATLGALSLTFPISLVNFGQLPLLSPLANILTTPLIPLAMLLGFVSIIGDMIHHTLGIWIWFASWWLLEYILTVAHIFSGFKKTILTLNLGGYGIWFMILYYLFIIYRVALSKISTPPRAEGLRDAPWAG